MAARTLGWVVDDSHHVVIEKKVLKYTLTLSVSPPEAGSRGCNLWAYIDGMWHNYNPIVDPPERGVFKVDAGTEVPILAKAVGDWRFDRWSGDASGTDISITVVMDSDKSVTANFVREVEKEAEVGQFGFEVD